ncbi:hypothetical protein WICPIJ_001455 [Wickerhamomyces pijperi]|uniref:Transcription factor tau 91 kDa subunit n=1 Tax=Wickerhamomyces pijperi TaxID=599730 RepID=A0A9P8QDK3_WICPI|nr:hypothetical protein WICPIJ_001455 [Wickerhamomyces pijperi]
MTRPKRQTAKKVDYTQFVDPEADKDEGDFSDHDVTMDDFKDDHEEEDDDVDVDVDEEPEDGDKEPGQEPQGDIEDDEILMVEEIAKKAKKAAKSSSVKPKKPKTPKTATTTTPGKRGRKPKVIVPKEPKPAKNPADKTEAFAMKSITSFKEKMTRLFGYNTEKLVELISLKKNWENQMFSVPVEKCSEFNLADRQLPALLTSQEQQQEQGQGQETKYSAIDRDTYYDLFRTLDGNDVKSVQLNNDGQDTLQIQTGQTVVSDEGSIVLNCGANVTDMLWVSTETSTNDDMYLLVAISDDFSKLKPPPSSFYQTQPYTSGFQLYRMDGHTRELKLIRCIVHKFGNCWDLKLLSVTAGKLILSAMFNDMSVKFIEIPTSNTSPNHIEYLQLDSPFLEVTLYDETITCYDLSSQSDLLIVGTNTGNVIMYNLNISTSIPVKSHYITNSHIFSLSLGESHYDEPLVFGTSANGVTFAFNLSNIANSLNIFARSKGMSLLTKYIPQVYSFIQLDGQHPARIQSSRCLFFQYALSKHEGSIESVAVSPHHPMYLTGGSDGSVKIGSGLRRMMCGPKGNFQRLLTLWTFQYSKTMKVYRILKTFEVDKMGALDNSSNLPIYNREISINAMTWAQGRKQLGGWFAAACVSGLIVLDRAE